MRNCKVAAGLAASLLLGGCTVVPEPVLAGAPEATQEDLQAIALAIHNEARSEVGVAGLLYDDRLAQVAQAYAEDLARRGAFEHSDIADRPGQGENLWRGTAGRYSVREMIAPWVAEKRHYRAGLFPDVSTTGRMADVGHYTQIVWRDTRGVGCGMARGGGVDVLVCRYSPPGNVVGQRVY